MLNKRGQTEDNIEMVVVPIIVVVAFALIALFNSAYMVDIDRAKDAIFFQETTVEAFDAAFIGTDLLNLMKLEYKESTIGEVLATTQENRCDEELRQAINSYLDKSYNTKWLITLQKNGELFYECAGFEVAQITPYSANMTLPSNDPSTNLLIKLEAFQ